MKALSVKENVIRHRINQMPILQLIELWEETEKQVMSVELSVVREWLMNALEAKNPAAYNQWMDAEYRKPEDDMPRTYFLELMLY